MMGGLLHRADQLQEAEAFRAPPPLRATSLSFLELINFMEVGPGTPGAPSPAAHAPPPAAAAAPSGASSAMDFEAAHGWADGGIDAGAADRPYAAAGAMDAVAAGAARCAALGGGFLPSPFCEGAGDACGHRCSTSGSQTPSLDGATRGGQELTMAAVKVEEGDETFNFMFCSLPTIEQSLDSHESAEFDEFLKSSDGEAGAVSEPSPRHVLGALVNTPRSAPPLGQCDSWDSQKSVESEVLRRAMRKTMSEAGPGTNRPPKRGSLSALLPKDKLARKRASARRYYHNQQNKVYHFSDTISKLERENTTLAKELKQAFKRLDLLKKASRMVGQLPC